MNINTNLPSSNINYASRITYEDTHTIAKEKGSTVSDGSSSNHSYHASDKKTRAFCLHKAIKRCLLTASLSLVTVVGFTTLQYKPAVAQEVYGIPIEEIVNNSEYLLDLVWDIFREPPTVYPQYDSNMGEFFVIPAGDFNDLRGTRISANFHHKSWVPRGSRPVRVELTVHGPDDQIEWVRRNLSVHMKAEKPQKKDKDRGPGILQHGSQFELSYGTNGDRGYYFVERNSRIRGENLPNGVYFMLRRVS